MPPQPQVQPQAGAPQGAAPPASQKRKTVFQGDGAASGGLGQLIGIAGSASGNVYPIRGPLTIGSDPSNHIVLTDATTSGTHAQVAPQGEGYVLHDLGSTNGTYLNGQRIMGPVVLQEGDLAKIGGSQFKFTLQG